MWTGSDERMLLRTTLVCEGVGEQARVEEQGMEPVATPPAAEGGNSC